jgi:hypothetical protein
MQNDETIVRKLKLVAKSIMVPISEKNSTFKTNIVLPEKMSGKTPQTWEWVDSFTPQSFLTDGRRNDKCVQTLITKE